MAEEMREQERKSKGWFEMLRRLLELAFKVLDGALPEAVYHREAVILLF